MYTKFYGLSKKPFALTPDPNAVYMSETHQEGLAILRYGVLSKKGFLVLTADVGSGKTTLLQAMVNSLEPSDHLCLLNNPILFRDEFFTYLAKKFNIQWQGNKANFLIAFGKFLEECYKKDERVLLIIDEAHVLPVDLLEEVRLLSNVEGKDQDVLSIFLVGQPELNERMSDDRLLPLRQRIGIRFHLRRFSREETGNYIIFRMQNAGARHRNIFAEEAVTVIHRVSRGTPRLINIVCDHALLTGFSENRTTIGPDLVRECVKELHFPGENNPLPVSNSILPGVARRYGWGIVFGVVVFVLVLVAVEIIPQTRSISLLGKVLPQEWVQNLHFLTSPAGG